MTALLPLMGAGLLLGAAGSLHCVGMCGPLVLAVPSRGMGGWALYHLARATSYALMGAMLALLGAGVALAGWQQGLSIALGLGLLVMVLLGGHTPRVPVLQRLNEIVARAMQRLLRGAGGPASMAGLGFANGLLPCGLSFAALVGASATAEPVAGAAFMFAFGLGTAPLLLVLSGVGRLPRLRRWASGAARWAAVAVALLLVVRGLGLGIPYVSPQLTGSPVHTPAAQAARPSCH